MDFTWFLRRIRMRNLIESHHGMLYGSKVVATPEEEATLAPGTVYKRLDTGDILYMQQ